MKKKAGWWALGLCVLGLVLAVCGVYRGIQGDRVMGMLDGIMAWLIVIYLELRYEL